MRAAYDKLEKKSRLINQEKGLKTEVGELSQPKLLKAVEAVLVTPANSLQVAREPGVSLHFCTPECLR